MVANKMDDVYVEDMAFGEYVDMKCTGTAYTLDPKNQACNGWGDVTQKECITKCMEHAHPHHCKSGHECSAAVFYPHKLGKTVPSHMHTKGWCHLFERKECLKFSLSGGTPITFVKEKTPGSKKSDRRLFGEGMKKVKCKRDGECGTGICIGWSYLHTKYSGKCGATSSALDGTSCSRDKECKTGHCVAGYCLTAGQECTNGKNQYGCDYDVTVVKKAGTQLGIGITFPGMVISDIEGDGFVPKWNAQHPLRAVKSGDRIVSINGKMFWDDACLKELSNGGLLEMKMMGGHITKAQKMIEATLARAQDRSAVKRMLDDDDDDDDDDNDDHKLSKKGDESSKKDDDDDESSKDEKSAKPKVSSCQEDDDCDAGLCIGWSHLNKSFKGTCGPESSQGKDGVCSRDKECKSGHCIVGYCLEVGMECKDGSNDFGCDYDIEIKKGKEDKLGIEIDIPAMIIAKILDDGAIPDWNADHSHREVVKSGKRKVEAKRGDGDGSEKWSVESTMNRFKEHSVSPAVMASALLACSTLGAAAAIFVMRRRHANSGLPKDLKDAESLLEVDKCAE
jgi:hypothetical protein